MTDRYIFHLSLPVADLESAKRFYVDVLGASIGRENELWMDVLLWGHQLTLQQAPAEVMPLECQGKRHFGVILPWSEWQRIADHLQSRCTPLLSGPEVLLKGTPQEHAKVHLTDPSHNIIEIKAYRDVASTVEQS